MTIEIKVSIGELVDKLVILTIKSFKITHEHKLKNVIKERDYLAKVLEAIEEKEKMRELCDALIDVNEALWDAEDKLRIHEIENNFNKLFIDVARSIYKLNDKRAAIKRKINELYESEFIEEKSY